MGIFQFSNNFLTGLKDVDDQHRSLIDLLNKFGESILSTESNTDDLDPLFQKLAKYAQYHFAEEENLMQEIKIDKRHYNLHVAKHLNFLNDLTILHKEMGSDKEKLSKQLLNFLTHWLVYHILGSDKNMAKQIEAIQSGTDPSKAFEIIEKKSDSSTEPLLLAINGLFQIVSTRNNELLKLNESLEQKVKERTQELHEANKHLLEISLTDVLTKLPNRRYAIQQLKKHWETVTHSGKPIFLMMIDADHFKDVNDKYGHDAGDLVLCELSKILQHSVRTDDFVSRLGGDEFLIICPETNSSGGLQIAETIRKNVSQMRVKTGDGYWHGSVSVGVAVRRDDMETFEALIKAADEGVYAAKRAGKNCVRPS